MKVMNLNTVIDRDIALEDDHLRYCIGPDGASFICDIQALPLLLQHNWLIDAYGYPVTKIHKRTTRFSRMLINPPLGFYVDHINGDPADNRKDNLRLASEINNQRNMCLPKHNTSGFKGVGFRKDRGKFRAYISIHNKTKHLGYFDNAEDAARAYDKAARFYFGNFACVNFPETGEQSCFRNEDK
jgi:hypothetical protein